MILTRFHEAARWVIGLLVRFDKSLQQHPILWFLGLCLCTLVGLVLSEPFQHQLPPDAGDRLQVYAVADVMLTAVCYAALRLGLPVYLWFVQKVQPRLFDED